MTVPACPRCGSDAWNSILDWDFTVTFGGERVAIVCTNCELVAWQWTGLMGGFGVESYPSNQKFVHLEARDLEVDYLPEDAVQVTHRRSGIVVKADAYERQPDNARAALQAIGLQLRDREERAALV